MSSTSVAHARLCAQPGSATRPQSRRTRCVAQAKAGRQEAEAQQAQLFQLNRREAISAAFAVASSLGLAPLPAFAKPAYEAGDGAEVGNYLPPSKVDGYVFFKPPPAKTPALRSGLINPEQPYNFVVPASAGWKEQKVANAISGNYCQPRCDEPTTEVIFASGSQGKVQVIISPLTKVTSKSEPKIEEIGTPEKLIESFGPYITGDTIDAANDVVSAVSKTYAGQTYYQYELFTPTALAGAHNLASVTFKGNLSLLIVASATEKQWAAGEKPLRQVIESFRVGLAESLAA